MRAGAIGAKQNSFRHLGCMQQGSFEAGWESRGKAKHLHVAVKCLISVHKVIEAGKS
jgi:hypothetical protein